MTDICLIDLIFFKFKLLSLLKHGSPEEYVSMKYNLYGYEFVHINNKSLTWIPVKRLMLQDLQVAVKF